MKKLRVFLAVVTILSAVLRLYDLGKTPSSLEWDEVAIGYDAYSILKTGRDQFGKFLPLTFRSLDDYKPPIYEYLTVPAIALFGPTAFAVRLPSALSGITMVILVFFFARFIFNHISLTQKFNNRAALLVSFFLAVSPWHIQLSRAAFEVNLAATITLFAVYYFIKGLYQNHYFVLSTVFFGLDLFSYHSARVVAPLLLLTLILLFNRNLPSKKVVLTHLIIFALFFLAVFPILISKDAQIRFRATNIFKPATRYLDDIDLDEVFLKKRLSDTKAGYSLSGKMFHNQRLIYTDYTTLKKALKNYVSNFGFEYLFIKGDAPLHHAPEFGLFHIFEFPFLVIGLIYLFFKGLNRYSLFLFIWLALAPLPNAVTREAPHAVRTLLALPSYQLFIAAGFIAVYRLSVLQRRWVYLPFFIILAFLFLLNNSYYLHQYYVHTNYDVATNWKYGREQAVVYTESVKHKYDNVLVSLSVDMPYIFWLYYSKYSPVQYFNEGGTVSGGFAEEGNKFDKYQFRNYKYWQLIGKGKYLLVGTPIDFPSGAKIINTIYNPDGTVALEFAEN